MSRLNVWHAVAVNKSNRPVLSEEEHNIYVKEGVGIYQGKAKIIASQNGRVYLTNKRIIYVDSTDQQRAMALNLSDILRAEFIERFLRSSPKVKVYLKNEEAPQERKLDVAWTCVICSYNNHVASVDMDNLPRCVSCGVPPSREVVEKALLKGPAGSLNLEQCPTCTFINHRLMRNCELCGTALTDRSRLAEAASNPNPLNLKLEEEETYTNEKPYVKISFRKGGDSSFYEHATEAIDAVKWANLESRGGISGTKLATPPPPRVSTAGIHSLERLGDQQRRRNEDLLSHSLDDLEQLMFKAPEVIAAAASFSLLIKKRTGTATIPPLSINKSSRLFHQELARHVSEYLIECELTRATSMVTVADVFASYNRFRIHTQGFGCELVPSADLWRSLEMLDTLNLPIRLKSYRLGLVVVARRLMLLEEHLHSSITAFMVASENKFKYEKLRAEFAVDTDGYLRTRYRSFPGSTVAEIAAHFGWSHSVCLEELDRCVDVQAVVVDKHVLGTFFFVNKFGGEADGVESDEAVGKRVQQDVEEEQRAISAEWEKRTGSGYVAESLESLESGLLGSEKRREEGSEATAFTLLDINKQLEHISILLTSPTHTGTLESPTPHSEWSQGKKRPEQVFGPVLDSTAMLVRYSGVLEMASTSLSDLAGLDFTAN